jgi:hypothetical protein
MGGRDAGGITGNGGDGRASAGQESLNSASGVDGYADHGVDVLHRQRRSGDGRLQPEGQVVSERVDELAELLADSCDELDGGVVLAAWSPHDQD